MTYLTTETGGGEETTDQRQCGPSQGPLYPLTDHVSCLLAPSSLARRGLTPCGASLGLRCPQLTSNQKSRRHRTSTKFNIKDTLSQCGKTKAKQAEPGSRKERSHCPPGWRVKGRWWNLMGLQSWCFCGDWPGSRRGCCSCPGCPKSRRVEEPGQLLPANHLIFEPRNG